MFWLVESDKPEDVAMRDNMHALAMNAYAEHFHNTRTKLELGAYIGFLLSQFGLMLTRPEDEEKQEAIPHDTKSSNKH